MEDMKYGYARNVRTGNVSLSTSLFAAVPTERYQQQTGETE
jgi:hypothetical protein